jgi:cell division protein FtsB
MNPIGFAYSPPTVNGELLDVLTWSKPPGGGIMVTGRGNRMHPSFQKARAQHGVELWAYWNCVEAPDNLSNEQDAWQFKLADGSHPPFWPGRTADGKPRSQWPGNHLLDIRPGSLWLKHIVPKTVELVNLHKHDGLFLDTMGARPWSKTRTVDGRVIVGADWDTWPVEEQTQWITCMVNLARELAEAVAGRVKLVHNNLWANVIKQGHPAYAVAPQGEKYCNGVCLENPSGNVPSDFHKNYAKRTFGLLPRRVPVIDSTDADTVLWSKVEGVTHVCSVEKAISETYARLTPPVVPFTGKDEGEDEAENEALRARVAELTAENTTLHTQLDESQQKLATADAEISKLRDSLAKIHTLSAP